MGSGTAVGVPVTTMLSKRIRPVSLVAPSIVNRRAKNGLFATPTEGPKVAPNPPSPGSKGILGTRQ